MEANERDRRNHRRQMAEKDLEIPATGMSVLGHRRRTRREVEPLDFVD